LATQEVQGSVAERLEARGARRVLIGMAKNGQILTLRCEMPTCYCPDGRQRFDPWPDSRQAPERDWSPNPDHYPTLRMDHGPLKPWNVRLAHAYCNNMDFGWRSRIRRMLEKDPTLSFAKIAEALNKKKTVRAPPPAKSWTAKLVRKAYVS
jgi:hypothetical protein